MAQIIPLRRHTAIEASGDTLTMRIRYERDGLIYTCTCHSNDHSLLDLSPEERRQAIDVIYASRGVVLSAEIVRHFELSVMP